MTAERSCLLPEWRPQKFSNVQHECLRSLYVELFSESREAAVTPAKTQRDDETLTNVGTK